MGSNAIVSSIFCFLLLASTATAAKVYLSAHIFNRINGTQGRALTEGNPYVDQLEERGERGPPQKLCPIDFKNFDFTPLTSRCKGPPYSGRICCDAFKRLICPFTNDLNDERTDCDAALFANIQSQCKYPLRLFSDNCKEGPQGLDCDDVLEGAKPNATKPAVAVGKPAVAKPAVAKPAVAVAKPAVAVAKAAVVKPAVAVAKPAVAKPAVAVAKAAVVKPAVAVAKAAVAKPAVAVAKPAVVKPAVAKPAVAKAAVVGKRNHRRRGRRGGRKHRGQRKLRLHRQKKQQ